MKKIEKIKFWFGLLLTFYAAFSGLIFFLESFELIEEILSKYDTSSIWEAGTGDGNGASNSPIFLGLCGIAGAILLISVKKPTNEEKKITKKVFDE
ncbi:MAG: hypothetical protein ACOC2U_01975 [bacterium]